MTKKEQCVEIALQNPAADRSQLMELFITQVGLSRATASTYASSVKKEVLDGADARAMKPSTPDESDAKIAARLKERFEVIDMLANASTLGQIRSLIVSGPAGLGKSFTIEQAIKNYDPDGDRTIIAKGFVRPTGLYLLLHEYRHKGCVIVLDDADSIFNDQDALNLLKAACDTTKKRELSWRSETRMTDADGEEIERQFTFEGTIIFITNKDFDAEVRRGGKQAEHFEALISRSHYVECDMKTVRDYIVRIKQVVGEGMLREQKGLDRAGEIRVMEFIEQHAENLRELTLRMALKLADVYLMDANKFESLARVSCFKAGVRI